MKWDEYPLINSAAECHILYDTSSRPQSYVRFQLRTLDDKLSVHTGFEPSCSLRLAVLYFHKQQRHLFGKVGGSSASSTLADAVATRICSVYARLAQNMLFLVCLSCFLHIRCERLWSSTVDHTTCGHSITCVHVYRTKEEWLTH